MCRYVAYLDIYLAFSSLKRTLTASDLLSRCWCVCVGVCDHEIIFKHKSRNEIEKVFSIYINPFQRQYFVTNVFSRRRTARGKIEREISSRSECAFFLSRFGCCRHDVLFTCFFRFFFPLTFPTAAAAAAIIFAEGISSCKHSHSHKHAYVYSILQKCMYVYSLRS